MKMLMLALLLTSAAFGQTTKIGIAIHCVSLPDDVVGSQLCSALREAVAKSLRYQEAVGNQQGWQIRLATMGIDDNQATAVSMTLIYHAIYVVNTVQVCGASVIKDCAQGMLSDSDDHIRSLEEAAEEAISMEQTGDCFVKDVFRVSFGAQIRKMQRVPYGNCSHKSLSPPHPHR